MMVRDEQVKVQILKTEEEQSCAHLGLDEALLLHESGALGPLLLALAYAAAQHLDLLDHLQ